MSHRDGDVFHIRATPPAECELCGKIDELRPYGPEGENVCFDCAMKDRAATERQFAKAIAGVDHLTVPADALARARKQ